MTKKCNSCGFERANADALCPRCHWWAYGAPMIVDWNTDHAASGDRERAFVDDFDVVVYVDGEWMISRSLQAVAQGNESNQERGKARALLALAAMRTVLP